MPPLCDHKTVQVAVEGRREAERLPWSFKGGTQDVQASPWTPWSPWSFEHVQNSRTKVAEEVGRSQVAQRRQDEGTHIAVVAEWTHSGRPLVAQLKCEHCVSIWATRLPSLYHHCASFGRPMASIERALWRPLCLHSATTATLEPPWRWFCLHSAFFARPVVPLQQLWSFKEGTRVVLQQLHRNRTFWVPATTERPNHFYGRTRVARRSQPCVKGPLVNRGPATMNPASHTVVVSPVTLGDAIYSMNWLVVCSSPSYIINQSLIIVSWSPWSKFQWNKKGKKYIIFRSRKSFLKCFSSLPSHL